MVRRVLLVGVALSLGGCVTNTNTVSMQSAQVSAAGTGGRPATAPAPAAAPRTVLTRTAQIANARLVSVPKTTTAGSTLMLASFHSLARDCSPLGTVTARLVAAPLHGTVTISNGTAYSNYVPGDPPYACNAQRTAATIVQYRAEDGFAGQDVAEVGVFFPDGKAPTVRFDITVR